MISTRLSLFVSTAADARTNIFADSVVIINMSVLLVALGFAAARSYREHKDVGQWRRALDSQEFAMLESVMLGHGFSPNAASVTSNESRKVGDATRIDGLETDTKRS